MMYVCENCGEIVREEVFEDCDAVCPVCLGQLTEATKCEVCGEWFYAEEYEGVCNICLTEHASVDMALKLSKDNDCTDTVEINQFLVYMFTPEEIERVLIKELKDAEKIYSPIYKEKAMDYLLEDRSWYGEVLAQELNSSKE